jgi:hypothetical protein
MSRAELWLLHAATALVGGTGLVYAWMLYLLKPADPFSVVHHAWQPAVQHLHVLAAPLLVFAAGLIWRRHVWAGWRSGIRARRRSGVAVALTLFPMIASGYLLQTAVDDAWRKAWVAVHLAASALWIAGYLAHQLTPRPANGANGTNGTIGGIERP